MKLVVPDYYNSFVCIADKCRHSCCIGWEIDVDTDTMEYYNSLEGEIGKNIRASIDHRDTPHFSLSDGDRCPHLDERGLCKIISEIGEGALCNICAEHPRFRSYFTSREEIGLGLCCEEACRIVLGRAEPMRLVALNDDGENESPTEDERAFFDRRDEIFAVLQDRRFDIDSRIERLAAICDAKLSMTDTESWCEFFLSLERLDEEWGSRLSALRESGIKHIDKPCKALPGEVGEQLLVYFVYRHLYGAVFDGNYSDRVKFAILSFYMIRAVSTVLAEADITFPLICEVARMFSSEIEYSEDNLAELLLELSF